MTDNEKMDEIKDTAKKETENPRTYQFAKDVKLKECKYCCVMIPKKAKICPNCKMTLKKSWKRKVIAVVLLLLVLAAAAAGGYYYFYEYQPAQKTMAVVEGSDAMESETVGTDTAADSVLLTDVTDTNTADDAVELPQVLEVPEETEPQKDASEEGLEEEVKLTESTVTKEDICGADGPILDYADEDRIIFHDYCGMFVYDRQAEEIVTAFDLAEIGCQDTQGDAACEVSVQEDGTRIYLHPSGEEVWYEYDVDKELCMKKSYVEEDQTFFETELTGEYTDEDNTVFRSYACADLGEDCYLYLESGSGMIADLSYVIVKKGKQIEYQPLFAAYFEPADEDSEGEAEEVQQEEPEEQAVLSETTVAQIPYKDMIRRQEQYADTEFVLEVTILSQVDGGLFDDHIYYLCTGMDKQGSEQYYIVRDDRAKEELLILEGDVLRIQAALFDRCKLSADLVKTKPMVPALAMTACELVEE